MFLSYNKIYHLVVYIKASNRAQERVGKDAVLLFVFYQHELNQVFQKEHVECCKA